MQHLPAFEGLYDGRIVRESRPSENFHVVLFVLVSTLVCTEDGRWDRSLRCVCVIQGPGDRINVLCYVTRPIVISMSGMSPVFRFRETRERENRRIEALQKER